MLITSLEKQNSAYDTWYEFKKDLEKCLGYHLTNWEWLEVKPQSPLPWNYHHMKRSHAQARLFEGGLMWLAYVDSLRK